MTTSPQPEPTHDTTTNTKRHQAGLPVAKVRPIRDEVQRRVLTPTTELDLPTLAGSAGGPA